MAVIDKISKKDQFLYKWFLFLLVLVDVLVDVSSFAGNIVRSLPTTAFMV